MPFLDEQPYRVSDNGPTCREASINIALVCIGLAVAFMLGCGLAAVVWTL